MYVYHTIKVLSTVRKENDEIDAELFFFYLPLNLFLFWTIIVIVSARHITFFLYRVRYEIKVSMLRRFLQVFLKIRFAFRRLNLKFMEEMLFRLIDKCQLINLTDELNHILYFQRTYIIIIWRNSLDYT